MTTPYKRVLVTGASGWVGRLALETAVQGLKNTAVRPFATCRKTVFISGGFTVASPLESLLVEEPGDSTLLIHCGFPTQEKVTSMGDRGYLGAVAGLQPLILGAVQRSAPLNLIYLSSGAATSVENGAGVPHRTRIYGQAKLDDEAVYREAIAATGGRLCIVRAFALSGPYMTKPETYALGNMILQALDRGTIEVKATRPVRRSYMAIDDMLRIAMHAVGELDAGESITFETAGEVVEVGELASRVLGVLGCDPEAVTRPPLDPDAPADDYLGDPVLVGELAARAGVVPAGLDEQIAVTAEWLRREVAT